MAGHGGLPRLADAALAALGLVAASPLLLVLVLVVRTSSRGPALFRQIRVGRDGRKFTMVKLRSMHQGASGAAVTATGDTRVTRAGRYLRRTKLDELPELWNVLVGDMALVGPRPEVPRFVDLDDPRWRKVLSVRPGITDPTTVELRDEESLLSGTGDPEALYRDQLLPAKLEAYAKYIDRRTAGSDLAVLATTVAHVVRGLLPGS